MTMIKRLFYFTAISHHLWVRCIEVNYTWLYYGVSMKYLWSIGWTNLCVYFKIYSVGLFNTIWHFVVKYWHGFYCYKTINTNTHILPQNHIEHINRPIDHY